MNAVQPESTRIRLPAAAARLATLLLACGSIACSASDPPGAPDTATAGSGAGAAQGSPGSGGAGNGGSSASNGGSTLDCDDGLLDCDLDPANGCEVEAGTTEQHCGACGRDCLGGTCQAGACTLFTLAEGQYDEYGANSIAVDDDWVYFLVGPDQYPDEYLTRVFRVPDHGGQPELLAHAPAQFADALAVDDAWLYLLDADGLYRLPKSGGALDVLLADATLFIWNYSVLAMDDAWIYVLSADLGFVRVPKAGGSPQPYGIQSTDADFPNAVTPIDGVPHWVTCDGRVLRSVDGAAPTLVGSMAPGGACVAAALPSDGAHVYISDPLPRFDSAIHRLALDGSGSELFADDIRTGGMATSSRELFWYGNGVVAKPFDGAPAVQLAQTVGVTTFATRGGTVFWLEDGYNGTGGSTWVVRGWVR